MRLHVLKTHKLFIGGKFPRSESGRVLPVISETGTHLANISHASRKDVRDAVTDARKGADAWKGATAYLRSQIIYRLAEMLESRAGDMAAEISAATGARPAAAAAEVSAAVDRLVHLAGWPDKLTQVFGSVNPVAAPFFNFSTLEPTGVVVVFAPDAPALMAAVSLIGTALAAGNACILVASERYPTPITSLTECLATSDLPAGAVNVLTGLRAELAPCVAGHHDIDAVLDASGIPALAKVLAEGAAVNLKRVYSWGAVDWNLPASSASPYQILDLTETKTTWHPVAV